MQISKEGGTRKDPRQKQRHVRSISPTAMPNGEGSKQQPRDAAAPESPTRLRRHELKCTKLCGPGRNHSRRQRGPISGNEDRRQMDGELRSPQRGRSPATCSQHFAACHSKSENEPSTTTTPSAKIPVSKTGIHGISNSGAEDSVNQPRPRPTEVRPRSYRSIAGKADTSPRHDFRLSQGSASRNLCLGWKPSESLSLGLG